MEAQYLQGLVAEFVGQLVEISSIEERGKELSGKIIALEDILYDYMGSEIINRGYFCYDSNKKYSDCDALEKEWAVTLNQNAIDVFGKSIDEMLKENAHISISATQKNATLYVNDGSVQDDQKIEIKSQSKNQGLCL